VCRRFSALKCSFQKSYIYFYFRCSCSILFAFLVFFAYTLHCIVSCLNFMRTLKGRTSDDESGTTDQGRSHGFLRGAPTFPSLPFPHFPFSLLSFPLLPLLPSPPLRHPPQNPAMGLGERCKFPSSCERIFDVFTALKTHVMGGNIFHSYSLKKFYFKFDEICDLQKWLSLITFCRPQVVQHSGGGSSTRTPSPLNRAVWQIHDAVDDRRSDARR